MKCLLSYTCSLLLLNSVLCGNSVLIKKNESKGAVKNIDAHVVFLKKKMPNYSRNLVSTCHLSRTYKLSFDWDQLDRLVSMATAVSLIKYISVLNFDTIRNDISQRRLPNVSVNVPLLCFFGSYMLSRVPKLVMMCKELLRGEFVRGLEHSTFLSLFASLYLLTRIRKLI